MAASNMIYDRKTGRMRTKKRRTASQRRSTSASARGKTSSSTKLAIARGVRRALRTGRTTTGRKVRK